MKSLRFPGLPLRLRNVLVISRKPAAVRWEAANASRRLSRGEEGRMWATRRVNYYRRILAAYLDRVKASSPSGTTFPRRTPTSALTILASITSRSSEGELSRHHDAAGVPMLDYRGALGLQYNPIAIAQYGLETITFGCARPIQSDDASSF